MLFMHIGMPKTGTTYLQRILANNRKTLLDNGLLYPDDWRNREGIAHHCLGEDIANIHDPLSSGRVERFARSAGMLARKNDMLISSEAIINVFNPRGFDQFMTLADDLHRSSTLEVIVCLRRLDRFFESMYLHSIKTGEIRIGFDEYIAQRYGWARDFFWYLAKLRYESAANLSTMIFERQVDLMSGFLSLLGRTTDGIDYSTEPDNAKLGLKMQSFLLFYDQFELENRDCCSDRIELLRRIGKLGFRFDNDIYDYTILENEVRSTIISASLESAESCGIFEYSDYYVDLPSKTPYYSLDISVLDNADIECFDRFLGAGRIALAS